MLYATFAIRYKKRCSTYASITLASYSGAKLQITVVKKDFSLEKHKDRTLPLTILTKMIASQR